MSSQRKLDVFFGSRKRPAEESLTNSPSRPRLETTTDIREASNEKQPNLPIVETPKKIRVFRNEWLKTFPWLKKIEIDNKLRVTCTWCQDAKKKNPFATVGSTNFQCSAFSRHEQNPEHLLVAEGRRSSKKLTIPVVVEKIADEIDDATDKSKTSQMRTLYHLAKNGQPLSQYTNLITLQQQNDCPHLQDKSKIYTSERVKMEMLEAINDTIVEEIDTNLNSSKFLGIIVDESTDITIHKKLNIYIRCLRKESNEPVTHFVTCVAIHDGKANTIVDEIKKVFTQKEIDFSKCLSLASDGAAVMTGKHNGVGAILRREHNPRLVQVHCVAHRIALAAGQACRDIPYFNEYQSTLKLIYRFYNNSAIRYNELRAMAAVLEDDNMRHLTLKEPASFRWLSLDAAVTAILEVYPALVKALENDAASRNNTESKGLYNRIKSVTFLLSTAFLKDVLSVVTKLSKIFQKDEIDVSVVNSLLVSTSERLTQFQTVNGKELEKVYADISNGTYKQVKLLDKECLRIQFQNNSQEYLFAEAKPG